MSNEYENTGMMFDLRSTDNLDLFARVCAMLQCHQVEFTVIKDGNWATIVIGGSSK